MNIKQDSVKAGICDAFDFWLTQHPISMGDMMMEALEKAFTKYLESHSDEIISAIAKQA